MLKKIIKSFLLIIVAGSAGAAITFFLIKKKNDKIIKDKDSRISKFYDYFQLTNQWLLLKNKDKSIAEYFKTNKYKKIAIYGIGELGSRMNEELKKSDIEILYVIDVNADTVYSDLPILTLEDELTPVDVIVVTPTYAFDNIKEKLRGKVDCPIISIEDVIYGM